MRVAVFSTKRYDRQFLDDALSGAGHQPVFLEARLSADTAALAAGADAVCIFVNDRADAEALDLLASLGVRLLALRCAGFNNVDLAATKRHGITVARVPAYSPHAVAEHAVALMLTLNRKIHRAFNRVREGNFALDGLLGFDMVSKTIGVVGTGEIGSVTARILSGFGCQVVAHDLRSDPACEAIGVRYVSMNELLASSDIITLHCPLTTTTHHLIDGRALERMKPGAMLINTSRGAVIDTPAVISALKSGHLGSLGIDVYEEEANIFFEDHSATAIGDDVFARLLTFPNVIITGHQGFFTTEALTAIAETTLANISTFESTGRPLHEVTAANP